MLKISLRLKDSFKYTNSSKIMGMFIIKAHLFAFLVLFSPTWQHDGNRCSRINEPKMTSNHSHFSCIDVQASTVTQKMKNSNLFQKITDTSYETDYLTCKSRGWFRTVTVLICPRFWASASACVPRCVCVCVRACRCLPRPVNDRLSVKGMSLSGWCLCELCPGAGSHHQQRADTLWTGNITLWFPHERKALLSQSAQLTPNLILWLFPHNSQKRSAGYLQQ